MKLDFKFANLCGTVYKQGNILFTPDGNSIISPVGNRVSVFDIINNKSFTFPFENSRDITRIALSPNATLLITIDDEGKALLINYQRRVVLHHHSFKAHVHDIKFSPNGKFIAVTNGKNVQVWRAPGFTMDFAPFVLFKTFTGHFDDVLNVNWSMDSKAIITGSRDMTTRVFSLENIEGMVPSLLSGHKDKLIGAWFTEDASIIYTVSKDGALFEWKKHSDEDLKDDVDEEELEKVQKKQRKLKNSQIQAAKPRVFWRITAKHFFQQNNSKVISCSFHAKTKIMTVGFSTGIFSIYELPDFTNIHSLSISQKKIDAMDINSTGEWIAFGCSKLGQLLVWEWQSESHVLKQQGHSNDMTCLSYSPDGQFIATGGDDGRVKLWNTSSGFSFVTFSEHQSGISALEFAKQGQIVFSASLDGTIRAYDLIRYRNFKTFASPVPVQFGCLAIDTTGEVICAGSLDTFEVYMWSVQTGKLLDVFSGHTGPVCSMSFSPIDGTLATGSWDKTIKIWNVFSRDSAPETHHHDHEIITIAYRPDGRQLAASTLDGQIHFWDLQEGKLVSSIEGRKDIAGGRKAHDRITAQNSANGKSFNSLCYTSDGSCIIGGGSSKFICIYDVLTSALLKKFQISHNQSLDGMKEFLNSKNITEAGPLDLIDDSEHSDKEDRVTKMPGVISGDPSLRRTKPEARTKCVRFSPTGRSWGAATTEGLLIYSLDDHIVFDPYDLEVDITEDSILEVLMGKDYLRALVMSFRLGEQYLTRLVYESVPHDSVNLLVRELPVKYLERMVKFLLQYADQTVVEKSKSVFSSSIKQKPFRLEFHLGWVSGLLKYHAAYLKDNSTNFASIIRGLQKSVNQISDDLSGLCDNNIFTIQYFSCKAKQSQIENEEQVVDDAVMIDI